MALGTNYTRNSRGKDLIIRAKIAYVGNPPDSDMVNRCLHLIRTEMSEKYARKLIRGFEKWQEERDRERIASLRGRKTY